MVAAMLPTVGAPNRTGTDQSYINALSAALPQNCLAVTSIRPVNGTVDHRGAGHGHDRRRPGDERRGDDTRAECRNARPGLLLHAGECARCAANMNASCAIRAIG
jgi:hypothetical protein